MRAGDVLADRYRLDELLGGGGMGEIWAGFDLNLRRRVAVKLILADLRDGGGDAEQSSARFRREAEAAARINHRNITTVHDLGEHCAAEDRHGAKRIRPFMVLEFLDGHDLGSLAGRAPGGLPVEDVLEYGEQICGGLAAAHAAGIVHRDVKPANLVLVADGTVKICDFGIARFENATSELTAAGALVGTPAYMAPEQLEGRRVDHRTDLYALGCTLYHLLTGRTVFPSDDLRGLVAMHLTKTPDPPSAHRPAVPAAVDELVAALLAKDPARRPSTASEVAALLRAARERLKYGSEQAAAPAPEQPPARVAPSPAGRRPRPAGPPLTEHRAVVTAVAFGRDRRTLASIGRDKAVRIWDLADPADPRPRGEPVTGYLSVAFSPDGRAFAAPASGGVDLWDARNPRPSPRHLEPPRQLYAPFVSLVAFHPGGEIIAGGGTTGGSGFVCLWEAATGESFGSPMENSYNGQFSSMAFSSDGELLATADRQGVRLWDAQRGIPLSPPAANTAYVSSLAFSPVRRILATAEEPGIRLWDAASSRALRPLNDTPLQGRTATAFSPDGEILVASGEDHTIRAWDVRNPADPRLLGTSDSEHIDRISSIAFSPDGTLLATASDDFTIRLWHF